MKILDLFSGLKGWSAGFSGAEICSIDIDAAFEPTIAMDIMELTVQDLPFKPDVILASPPCESFSVASIGVHWNRDYSPKSQQAEQSVKLVQKTVQLIKEIQPKVAIIENPRGMLRKLNLIPANPITVWYCHYGEKRAKPTDLFGLPFPVGWSARKPCHYQRNNHDVGCCCFDHNAAPRGSQTGTQGMGSYEIKSKIPIQLSTEIATACATRR
jgi:hypothetical protein